MLFRLALLFSAMAALAYASPSSRMTRQTVKNTDCGIRNTQKDGDTQVVEFPWNIVIYERRESSGSDGVWEYLCFGSLITPKTVVSVAHCFWKLSKDEKKDASLFKMAAGKNVRTWDNTTNPRVQICDVQDIKIPVLFNARVTNYQSDIALLTVASPFELTTTVSPVCLDFDSELERRQLTEGNKGVVASWGWTDGRLNDALRYVELPYASRATCSAGIPPEAINILTNDKICTGPVGTGKQSLCRGDSGTGLVFQDPDTKHYYLRGVSSIAFQAFPSSSELCNPDYLGFTLLSQHQQFIEENL